MTEQRYSDIYKYVQKNKNPAVDEKGSTPDNRLALGETQYGGEPVQKFIRNDGRLIPDTGIKK